MVDFNLKAMVEQENSNASTIDLALVKNYMRIDFDDVDNDKMIEVFLESAKAFTQSYLNWKFVDVEVIPKEITIAVLSITEHWYKNRGVMSEEATMNELPYVFAGILDMHRKYNIGFTPEGGDVSGPIWSTQ